MGRHRKLSRLIPGDTIEVEVTALDEKGKGKGQEPGGAEVSLPGVLVGERISARVVHVSGRGRIFAEPLEVLHAAPDRVDPRCPHFLACGGCDFLHASLEAQHAFKRLLVSDALAEEAEEVVPSPEPLGYRALAKLVVGPGRILGSYAPGTHDVVDMRSCAIHAPAVEAVVDAVRSELVAAPADDLRYVIVRGSLSQGATVVTLVARSPGSVAARWIAERIATRADVARVVLNVNDQEGDALLVPGQDLVLFEGELPVDRVADIPQTLESGAFAQINPGAAERLYRLVAGSIPAGARVLDLYSGSGGIALAVAAAGAGSVLGIELNPDAVRAAIASAKAVGLQDKARFRAARAEEAIVDVEPFEALVVNPPRRGLSPRVIEALRSRAPFRLVYVSCEPKTLARDLRELGKLLPLQIERIVPVDLFPQTRHVETVVSCEVGLGRSPP